MVIVPGAKKSRIALLYAVFAIPLAAIGVYSTSVMFADTATDNKVSVAVEKAYYRVGEEVEFTITNESDQPVSVENHCPDEPMSVYRLDATGWVRVHDRANQTKCAGEQRDFTVPAHSYIKGDYDAWPQLFAIPGQYRIGLTVTGSTDVSTADFSVIQ